MADLTNSALRAIDAGLAVIPIRHGTKKAAVAWGIYQTRRPTRDEIVQMFRNITDIAILCGATSENLEVIDFDDPDMYPRWVLAMEMDGHDDIVQRFVVQQTPSGGCHVLYRCDTIEGNQKLALKPDGNVAIETRGEGGYIVSAPTPGYKLTQGKFAAIPRVTPAARDAMLENARWLCRAPKETTDDPFPKAAQGPGAADQYNKETSWADLLTRHGWTIGKRARNGRTPVTRPGKDARDGISGTLSEDGEILYVFSTNALGFEPDRAYSKFQVFAILEHGGDMSQAARAHLRAGQGRNAPQRPLNATETGDKEFRDAWVTLHGIDPKETDWLCHPVIPLGYLTMIQGDPGVGKSTVGLSIAASVSRGAPIMGFGECEPGNVLVVSLEDSIAEVIVPRLIAAEADLARIRAYRGDDLVLDVEQLEDEIGRWDARFVLLDPVIALVGAARDINKANETREFMKQLAGVAERTHSAICLIHHMNKATGGRALYRSVGSIDFVAAVRSVLMAGHDPDDRDRCAIAHIKCNLAPLRKSVGYSIGEFGLSWTGDSDLTAERMCEVPDRKKAASRDDAGEFLLQLLANTPMSSDDVIEFGAAQGYSRSTLFRAKRDLAGRIKAEGGRGGWTWKLAD